MLFWLCLIIAIVSLVGGCHVNKHTWSDWGVVLLIVGTITLIIAVILGICVMATQIDEAAAFEADKQLYESLYYQAENNIYENDNDLGKAELMQKITDWNRDLAKRRVFMHNFWVGNLYYDYYDQLEFIPLDIIK